MAYNELIKNFIHIREYMKQFYIYGFKSRTEYHNKSTRSYDDERRRIESWLEDYMHFRQTADGKQIFISIDSHFYCHNPLYKAWKTRSFTDKDIILHFIIFDILNNSDITLTVSEIIEKIDNDYLTFFSNPPSFDESTVRKKLKEYVTLGLLSSEKIGKAVKYRRTSSSPFTQTDVLNFFSEIAPCGVIGSFILDKIDTYKDNFTFKHHYITNALDSEILYELFDAMNEKIEIKLTINRRKSNGFHEHTVVPLRIFIGVQSGRQYLLGYQRSTKRITSFRLDYIFSIEKIAVVDDYTELRQVLDCMQKNMWGVSTQGQSGRIEHIDFTIKYNPGEEYIYHRLEREKRCGTVEKINDYSCRFSADVFDTNEMIPWIRTFICRITEIHFSNKALEKRFKADIEEMYKLYGLDRGADNDFQ
ncbi:MAG: WYL domain-containing protein [Acutalibacteraceae bacterium]